MLGVFVGMAGHTFFYAKGYSYLLNDPVTCMNCHIMRGQVRVQLDGHMFWLPGSQDAWYRANGSPYVNLFVTIARLWRSRRSSSGFYTPSRMAATPYL